MSASNTVADLFNLAILAERAAETLYTRMAEQFAAYHEVAQFWDMYARQEAAHADWLRQLADSLEDAQLAAPADPTILQDAQKILQFSLEHTLASVKNLDDAYQLATEMENAETNAIFSFLTEHFAPTDKLRTFLRSQLTSHLSALLIDFPLEFQSTERRRQVIAV